MPFMLIWSFLQAPSFQLVFFQSMHIYENIVPLLCFKFAYLSACSIIKTWRFSVEKAGEAYAPNEQPAKSSKEKMSKAERRALQESQRAAKAAAKGVYYSFLHVPHCSCYFLWKVLVDVMWVTLNLDSFLLVIYNQSIICIN